MQRILFRGIKLVANPEHLEHLAQADIRPIAPFVKTLSFVTPPNCWTHTLESFREVIVAQAIQRYAHDHEIWDEYISYGYMGGDGHQLFIRKYWNDKFPLSDNHIRTKFERYNVDAKDAKDLLHGENLRIAWVGALRKLPHSLDLRFLSVEFDETDSSHLPVQPDCVIRPHDHDDCHEEMTCRRIAAPVGEALFAAGIACVAEARVKVQNLDVACVMTGQFTWETLSGWTELDLSQMQKFEFQPQVQSMRGESLDSFGGETVVAERAADATAAVMKKCKDSLLKFEYKSLHCPMEWPGNEVIHLPALQDLSLSRGGIRAKNLKAWMTNMPSLTHLQLSLSGCLDGHWVDVFDAIRNHPKGITIYFDQIFVNDWTEYILGYQTDDFEKVLREEEHEDLQSDVYRSLKLYLSGKIGYNEALIEWFEDF